MAIKIISGYTNYFGISSTSISAILTKYLLNYKKELLKKIENKENKLTLKRKDNL